jgi:rare lipoprotein A
MPRSLCLVAAAVWLVALAACAKEAPLAATPAGYHGSVPSELQAPTPRSATPAPSQARARLTPPPSPPPPPRAAPGQHHLRERFARLPTLSALHGTASYYADKFAGRSTASGAPYEPRGYTAAHRSLPFGTVLRVTRVDGGQVVYVRVTDRGPFGRRGRILDLSRAAAEELQMLRAGVVEIKAEVLEYGPPRKKGRRRR